MKKNIAVFCEIVISALLLATIYSINSHVKVADYMVLVFIFVLSVLVYIKAWAKNKQMDAKVLLIEFANNIVKPYVAMQIGFWMYCICLGSEWKDSLNFALDVGYMAIVISFSLVIIVALAFIQWGIVQITKRCKCK